MCVWMDEQKVSSSLVCLSPSHPPSLPRITLSDRSSQYPPMIKKRVPENHDTRNKSLGAISPYRVTKRREKKELEAKSDEEIMKRKKMKEGPETFCRRKEGSTSNYFRCKYTAIECSLFFYNCLLCSPFFLISFSPLHLPRFFKI